jgi:O-antigen/teichoic acid export membrane protein
VTTVVAAKLQAVRSDPVLANSALIFITTAMMAGAGAVFWVIAARLASPASVGLAGSLVSAADSLALFAQLGLNIAVLRTMPTSNRKAADVLVASLVVGTAGAGFALIYSLLLPVTSPDLAKVLHSPAIIALYCLLVAATAINVLSDNVFLSLNRVWSYLRLNGVLLGLTKCVLPFLLAGAGALGLYGSVGGACLVCAAASLWVILRHVRGRWSLSPSRQLLAARRFAGAGYATYALTVLPLLVFPLFVINAQGSAAGAAYFVSYQVVTLLNAVILAVANATYAESERARHGRRDIVRRGGLTLMAFSVAGAAAMFVLAPYFLQIFGDHYVAGGTATLRVLAFSTVAAAFNYWSAIRLRLASHLRAMILVQLASTVVMVVLGGVLAPWGTVWVAAAWGIGHLVGGLGGYVVSHTVATFSDEAPVLVEHPAQPTAP